MTSSLITRVFCPPPQPLKYFHAYAAGSPGDSKLPVARALDKLFRLFYPTRVFVQVIKVFK